MWVLFCLFLFLTQKHYSRLNLLPSVLGVRPLPWRLSSSVYPQNRYSTGSGSASHPQPPRATVSQP